MARLPFCSWRYGESGSDFLSCKTWRACSFQTIAVNNRCESSENSRRTMLVSISALTLAASLCRRSRVSSRQVASYGLGSRRAPSHCSSQSTNMSTRRSSGTVQVQRHARIDSRFFSLADAFGGEASARCSRMHGTANLGCRLAHRLDVGISKRTALIE